MPDIRLEEMRQQPREVVELLMVFLMEAIEQEPEETNIRIKDRYIDMREIIMEEYTEIEMFGCSEEQQDTLLETVLKIVSEK
jgi:hypothetical protein